MIQRTLALAPPLALVAALGAACSSDESATPHQPAPGLEVAWCRLQEPASHETAPGQALAAAGRVRVTDLTDRTTGPDLDPLVLAKFGWGPHGSEPTAPGLAGDWVWKSASLSQDWDDVAAGEAGVDEYRASTTAPDVGSYDLAFAFSGDAGRTWRFCDLGGPPGADGSEDGYAPGTAGELVVRSNTDPCEPDPCTVTPRPVCEGNVQVFFEGPGACFPLGTTYRCDFPSRYGDDCAESAQVCFEGSCVTPVPVDFCQHLGPVEATFAGEPLWFDGLVRVAGITDRTPGVDGDPTLAIGFGFGWPGSRPDGTGWTWLADLGDGDAVEPPPGWTDAGLAEELRGSDVYRARLDGAPPGEYDTAWRFSADGGASWAYCDLDGADASLGSYSPSAAGKLIVPED